VSHDEHEVAVADLRRRPVQWGPTSAGEQAGAALDPDGMDWFRILACPSSSAFCKMPCSAPVASNEVLGT